MLKSVHRGFEMLTLNSTGVHRDRSRRATTGWVPVSSYVGCQRTVLPETARWAKRLAPPVAKSAEAALSHS